MRRIVKTVFPNDPRYLDCVHALSTEIAHLLKFDGRRRYHLMLAVSEGFTNAFLHGNQKEPDRSVTLKFEFQQESLRVSIEDEGVLPIENNVDIQRSLTLSENESGRGLPLIAKYVDRVALRYDPNIGNILTMTIRLDDESRITDKFFEVEVADGGHIRGHGRIYDPSTEGKT